MKKKIVFLIVIIFACLFLYVIHNKLNSSDIEVKKNVEEIQEEIIDILNEEDDIIAKINNMNITKKDVAWTKFFGDEMNNKDAILKTIEKHVLYEEAKKQNIIVSERSRKEQTDLIDAFREKEYTEEFLNKIDMTKDEYIENIEKQINIITIVSEFKNNIYNDIVNNQLNCENEKVKKLVKEYPIKKEQFDNDEIEYVDLVNFRDSIITEYINYIISTYEIIYK